MVDCEVLIKRIHIHILCEREGPERKFERYHGLIWQRTDNTIDLGLALVGID